MKEAFIMYMDGYLVNHEKEARKRKAIKKLLSSKIHENLLHLVSLVGSSSSGWVSVGGSPDRSSKLIINNEISSASERMGAGWKINGIFLLFYSIDKVLTMEFAYLWLLNIKTFRLKREIKCENC